MKINIYDNGTKYSEELDDGFPVSVKFIDTTIILNIADDESMSFPVKYRDFTYGKGKTIRVKISNNDCIENFCKNFESFSGMKLLEVTSKSKDTVFEIVC